MVQNNKTVMFVKLIVYVFKQVNNYTLKSEKGKRHYGNKKLVDFR